MGRGILTVLFLFVAISAMGQDVRTWRDVDGREIIGKMIAKSGTEVTVLVDGKNFTIPLERLSDGCRGYVRETIVQTPVSLRVETVSQRADTNDHLHTSGEGADSKTIKVHVSRVKGRVLNVECVWIGNHLSNKRYGIYQRKTRTVSSDTAVRFSATFAKDYEVDYDDDYKAYAIRVTDANGNEVGRMASMKSFERFLDEPAESDEKKIRGGGGPE